MSWSKRWIELDSVAEELRVFKSQGGALSGSHWLAHALRVEDLVPSVRVKRRHVFALVLLEHEGHEEGDALGVPVSIYLAAQDEAERLRWVAALKEAIAPHQARNQKRVEQAEHQHKAAWEQDDTALPTRPMAPPHPSRAASEPEPRSHRPPPSSWSWRTVKQSMVRGLAGSALGKKLLRDQSPNTHEFLGLLKALVERTRGAQAAEALDQALVRWGATVLVALQERRVAKERLAVVRDPVLGAWSDALDMLEIAFTLDEQRLALALAQAWRAVRLLAHDAGCDAASSDALELHVRHIADPVPPCPSAPPHDGRPSSKPFTSPPSGRRSGPCSRPCCAASGTRPSLNRGRGATPSRPQLEPSKSSRLAAPGAAPPAPPLPGALLTGETEGAQSAPPPCLLSHVRHPQKAASTLSGWGSLTKILT